MHGVARAEIEDESTPLVTGSGATITRGGRSGILVVGRSYAWEKRPSQMAVNVGGPSGFKRLKKQTLGGCYAGSRLDI